MKSDIDWALALFGKSVIKQQKWNALISQISDTRDLSCLDIGADNGVISYLFRQRGGEWKSADLDPETVSAIRSLVKTEVYQIDGGRTPFEDNAFDLVVIVDFLEHIPNDKGFIEELYRILKPGGELVINVPYPKNSLLRKFRVSIGQTDEAHGHLRHGYTENNLKSVVEPYFDLRRAKTYSRFFSECIDTFITWITSRGKKAHSKKGTVVTSADLRKAEKSFRIYSVLYPLFWIVSRLDGILFWTRGYKLIALAKSRKPAVSKKYKTTEVGIMQ
jgi:SAM-dependent methyltransferase